MLRLSALGLCVGLMGCGSTIGALDGLPAGPDLSDTPWPRLVDTPAAPEGRMIPAEGEQAKARLAQRRGEADARSARAQAVAPVSETLLARGEASRTRTDLPDRPTVNEADLVARAERLRARTQLANAPIAETDLLARAALLRERAALMANQSGQDATLAQSTLDQQRSTQPAFAAAPAGPPQPRVPVPLRSLDTPVVSSDFEERARLARERAARL